MRQWVEAWALSRQAEPPTELWDGFRIEIGSADHMVRYVILPPNAAALRRRVDGLTTPGTWLKVFGERTMVAPALPRPWRLGPPQHLMRLRLADPVPATVPHPYRIETVAAGPVALVRVCTPNGTAVARGQIAITGTLAVVDQVQTELAHRRRGLGRAVMITLCAHAAQRGATTGILVATVDGVALYRTLNWEIMEPVTQAWLPGPGR